MKPKTWPLICSHELVLNPTLAMRVKLRISSRMQKLKNRRDDLSTVLGRRILPRLFSYPKISTRTSLEGIMLPTISAICLRRLLAVKTSLQSSRVINV